MNNNDIKKKNDEWFNEIYILYYEFVYEMLKTHLYSKVDDDVSSCTQEVFLIAYVKIDTLRIHPYIKGWLGETAIRYSKNFNRLYLIHQQYYEEIEDIDIETIPSGENVMQKVIGEMSFEENIQANEVKKHLKKLSPDELKLYHLKYEQGLSNQEIGDFFSTSAQNIATRNTRLIKKFKKMIFGSR